jgi:hypothetical protein
MEAAHIRHRKGDCKGAEIEQGNQNKQSLVRRFIQSDGSDVSRGRLHGKMWGQPIEEAGGPLASSCSMHHSILVHLVMLEHLLEANASIDSMLVGVIFGGLLHCCTAASFMLKRI